MAANKVYMIVLMDSASDSYNYGVHEDEEAPNTVYVSLDAAKNALNSISENYDEFLPTAYGMAFPYDSVTFEEQLESEGFAPWGWGVLNTDDGVQRICLGVISLLVN
jgi:hypothetical protein